MSAPTQAPMQPSDCSICEGDPERCDIHDCGDAHRAAAPTQAAPAAKAALPEPAISITAADGRQVTYYTRDQIVAIINAAPAAQAVTGGEMEAIALIGGRLDVSGTKGLRHIETAIDHPRGAGLHIASGKDGAMLEAICKVCNNAAAAPAAAVEPIHYNSEHRTAMNRAAAVPEGLTK